MDQLSQEQLNAMRQMGQLNPGESATALGASNFMVSKSIPQTAPTGPGVGAIKGITSTLQHIGMPIAEGLNKILPGPPQQLGFTQEQLSPQNLSEQVGFTGERVGELFAPGGAEKAAFEKGASYISKIPELIGTGGRAAKALTGTLKAGLGGLIGGATFGGVTAAQTGSLEKGKEAVPLGIAGGGLGKVLEQVAPGLITALNKADFRLTPQAEAKSTKIAESAAQFETANKITGTPATKWNKLRSLTSQFEDTLKKSIPTNIAISKSQLIDSMKTELEQLKSTDQAIYSKASPKVNQAIKLLNSREGDILSVEEVLGNKRSWGASAFKTAQKSKQDPTVSSVGDYIVEQAYQKEFDGAYARAGEEIQLPERLRGYFGGAESVSPEEFNKIYSSAINARNLNFASQFKNDAGLIGRIFGLFAGETVGQSIGLGPAARLPLMATGEVLANEAPGWGRNILERGLYHPGAVEKSAKLKQSVSNTQNQ